MKVSPTGLLLILTQVPNTLFIEASNVFGSGPTSQRGRPFALVGQKNQDRNALTSFESLSISRGGSLYEEEEDDEYESEYDDEEEEEEEEKKVALSKSTVAATQKIKSKKISQATSKSKAAVNASLLKNKKKKKKAGVSLMKKLGIPYIVRACMNPLTVLSMTKAYFASLFNIAYLEQESSQGLRSALETKAKQEAAAVGGGGPGKKKGRKTMKPGRSKSLADLPQLSA